MGINVSKGTYRLAAAQPTAVFVGLSSGQLLPANQLRTSIMCINLSDGNISLAFGWPAVLDQGVTLQPGDVFFMDDRSIMDGVINAIAEINNSRLALQEWYIS